jgi:hypothetical protein
VGDAVVDTVVGETVVGDTVVGDTVVTVDEVVGDTVVGDTVVGDTVVGDIVGQAVPSAVPPMPLVYDVPRVPTLTRSPHSPALLYTRL